MYFGKGVGEKKHIPALPPTETTDIPSVAVRMAFVKTGLSRERSRKKFLIRPEATDKMSVARLLAFHAGMLYSRRSTSTSHDGLPLRIEGAFIEDIVHDGLEGLR